MKKILKTATEILSAEITIKCYLCGKGEIRMNAGAILGDRYHSLDSETRLKLKKFLTDKTEEFFQQYLLSLKFL